jgi:hypothetical protein
MQQTQPKPPPAPITKPKETAAKKPASKSAPAAPVAASKKSGGSKR